MHWLEMKEEPNGLEEREINRKHIPHGEMEEFRSHKVYLPTSDVDMLLDMQGDQEHDEEGNLSFNRLGKMMNPHFIDHVTKKHGNKAPLNDYEEAEYWRDMLGNFKDSGTHGDSEAVMLPSNVVKLFDSITGRRNINPRTGHKQYASLSGFLSSLSSMLPSFSSNRTAAPQSSGIVNFAAPNVGPSMSRMYGLPGQNMMQDFGRNIGGALSSLGNNFSSAASGLYNRLPANPFSRNTQMPSGGAPAFSNALALRNAAPQATSGTWADTLAPWGRSAATNIANFVAPSLGGAIGSVAGPYAANAAVGMAFPYIPRMIRSPIATFAGALGGNAIGRAAASHIAPRIAGPMGEYAGRQVGRGMDYLSNNMSSMGGMARDAFDNGASGFGRMANSALDSLYNYSPMGMRQSAGNAFSRGMPALEDMRRAAPQQPQQSWGSYFGDMLSNGLNSLSSYSPASMLTGAFGNMNRAAPRSSPGGGSPRGGQVNLPGFGGVGGGMGPGFAGYEERQPLLGQGGFMPWMEEPD